MNRKPIHTLTLAAIAGLALSAGAQDAAPKAKVSSSTTIMKSAGDQSYEVRIEDGKVVTFKVNGEAVDPSRYKLDAEGGFIVLMQEDAEPVIIDIPKFDAREFRFAARGMPALPAAPDDHDAPGAIQWLDAPDAPDAPGAPAAFAWSRGEPPKVMIGITHDDVSAELREKLELAEGEGVYVIEVREGLPAAKAGLEPGDVIIEVDGKHITKRDVLMEILKDRQPGDELKVIVLRGGEKQKLRLELAPYNAGRLGVTAPGSPLAVAPGRFQIRGLEGLNELEGIEGLEGLDDLEIFGDFDFDFDMEGLPPEAREEVQRALQKARESASEARSRALRLHIEADGRERKARVLEQHAERQAQEMQSFAEGHRVAREIAEKLRAMELEQRDHLLRVGPEGRAFIIQRGDEARAQGQGDAEGVIRLRAERDTLEARNRELEHRVEELERKLEELMARMEESQPRPRTR